MIYFSTSKINFWSDTFLIFTQIYGHYRNQLTYGETKDLLLWGVTAQGKPLRDHLEIKGHNEAVEYIMDILKGKDTEITEHFIRGLHKMIIPKPYYQDAITEDGNRTKKKVTPGEYKKTPNHVKTPTGEIFYFAKPEETPSKMKDLIDWYRKELKDNKDHPLIIATMFHYKFVRIHPFDDGNGRMSRLLMNLIFMKFGYPPVIIPTDMRDNYLDSLQYADAEDFDKFIEFIGERLIESFELWLKAAKGEQFEDLADIDKMVAMLKNKIDNQETPINLNLKVQRKIFDESVKPFIRNYITALSKFNVFFTNVVISLKIDKNDMRIDPHLRNSKVKNKESEYLKYIFEKCYDKINHDVKINEMILTYFFQSFINKLKKNFNIKLVLVIGFSEFYYTFRIKDILGASLKSGYSSILTEKQINEFIMKVAEFINSKIEGISEEIENFKKNL